MTVQHQSDHLFLLKRWMKPVLRSTWQAHGSHMGPTGDPLSPTMPIKLFCCHMNAKVIHLLGVSGAFEFGKVAVGVNSA